MITKSTPVHTHINLILVLISTFLWSRVFSIDTTGIYIYPCVVGSLVINGLLLNVSSQTSNTLNLCRHFLQLAILVLCIITFKKTALNYTTNSTYISFFIFATCSAIATLSPLETVLHANK